MTKIITDKEKILKYLKFKGISKNKFYLTTGLSVGFLDSGNSLGVDKLRKIVDNYHDFNPEWLISGKGNMIKTEGEVKELPVKHLTNSKSIPLIPLEAMAGWGTGEVRIMEYDTEKYVIPEFEDLKVDFMIRVKGSSMYPKYSSGDLVACKKVTIDTFFQWGKVYVLDTEQGAVIKRLNPSEKKDHITCVSDNDKYLPFDLHTQHIHSLAIVVGVIRLE